MRNIFQLIGAAGMIGLFMPSCLQAMMYQCVNSSGTSIYTDTPAQLGQCKPVPADSTPFHASTVQPAAVPPGGIGPSFQILSPTGGEEKLREAIANVIHVQREGHLLIVQARLNERREARLILDTGASHTVLSRRLAQDLGMLPTSSSTAVTLKTAGGSVQAEMIRLETIRVGAAESHNIPVAIHDLPDAPPGIDGLLGLTFLHAFLVTLDIHKGELRLQRRE